MTIQTWRFYHREVSSGRGPRAEAEKMPSLTRHQVNRQEENHQRCSEDRPPAGVAIPFQTCSVQTMPLYLPPQPQTITAFTAPPHPLLPPLKSPHHPSLTYTFITNRLSQLPRTREAVPGLSLEVLFRSGKLSHPAQRDSLCPHVTTAGFEFSSKPQDRSVFTRQAA